MSLRVTDLRTNTRTLPLGIDTPEPEFAWKLVSAEPDAVQTAYEIQVFASREFEGRPIWQIGKIASDAQFGVVYAGSPLESSHRYFWRVRAWDRIGVASEWSEPSWFETAILDPARWAAVWIGSAPPASKDDDSTLYLRGVVELPADDVVWARAYVSALGWYRLFVNGQDVTGNALVPRWTPLDKIIEYQTYDVTAQFRAGLNIVAMAIGDGRYRGCLGAIQRRARYGNRLAGFAQIELEFANGRKLTFVTDPRWHAGPGRILSSDPKRGERVDFRIRDDDWLLSPQPPTRFGPAHALPPMSRRLVAEEVDRVCEVDRILPQRILQSPSGKLIVDFGQNFAGFARIKLSGTEGASIRMTHSELLTPDGELDVDYIQLPFHHPPQERNEVILGGEPVWYQPWFTIHGFRCVEVDGLATLLDATDAEAIVMSSQLPTAGAFQCSDSRLNRLHHNVLWGLRSNFVDTPTDCPTRERSGWTGDIQVFAPAATTFVDAQAFLRRYLRNLAIEQLPNGTVPPFIPSESSEFSGGLPRVFRFVSTAVGWGDASILIPWTLYQRYGDRIVLERQYESMRRWVDHLERDARTRRGWGRRFSKRVGKLEDYVLDGGFHWGEWLRPGESFVTMAYEAFIAKAVVATAYFAHSTRLLSRIAEILGREEDARRYGVLSGHVREAWRAAFLHSDGHIGNNKQDDYVRALAFDLLTPQERPAALGRLVALIEKAGDHLGTGFLSTPMLLPVLAAHGRQDLAFRLLLQTTNPSWLSQVERGATTVWETWEGYDKNGKGKFSHNHYAFGTVATWLQEGIAGLSPAAPGYRRIRVAPLIGGGLTYAEGSIETPFGPAKSSWRLADGCVDLEIAIPPGTAAEVHLGDGRIEQVGSGTRQFRWAYHAVE